MKKSSTSKLRINVDIITDEEIKKALQKGYDDINLGNVKNAAEVFKEHKEKSRYYGSKDKMCTVNE